MFFFLYTDDVDVPGLDAMSCPMENRLKSLGIISDLDGTTSKSMKTSSLLKDINLETLVPLKKVDILTHISYTILQGCLKLESCPC